MSRDKQTVLAYHEAGHAVAHWLAGIPIKKITIGTGENEGPQVVTQGDLSSISIAFYGEHYLLIGWAGYACDYWHLQSVSPGASKDSIGGWFNDQETCLYILEELGLPDAVEEFYKCEALQVMRRPEVWAKVVELGEKLALGQPVSVGAFENHMKGLDQLNTCYWLDLQSRREEWKKQRKGDD
ncbi:hypothetical protein AB9E28_24640 [Rhizobium leguminosarum]|uniref:hypothetical protein n=1 Tax=Rhizobium leguminosarum TaxID=384 RepID=UPI003F9E7395